MFFLSVWMTLNGYSFPPNIYAYFIVFVLPITALTNPLIFTYKGTFGDSLLLYMCQPWNKVMH